MIKPLNEVGGALHLPLTQNPTGGSRDRTEVDHMLQAAYVSEGVATVKKMAITIALTARYSYVSNVGLLEY